MGLLRDIQDGALDDSSDIAGLLRRCLVLASRTHVPELAEWARAELGGYPTGTDVPDYRRREVSSRATLYGIGASIPEWPVPLGRIIGLLPEDERAAANELRFANIREGVAALQEHARSSAHTLALPWSADVMHYYLGKVVELSVHSCHRVVPRTVFVEVLSTIRTRLLEFVLEISEKHPELDADPAPEVDAEQRADVLGAANRVLIVGNNNTVHAGAFAGSIAVGDEKALRRMLQASGLSEGEAESVALALKEPGAVEDKSLTQKTKEALAKFAGKVGESVLVKAISAYLGLS